MKRMLKLGMVFVMASVVLQANSSAFFKKVDNETLGGGLVGTKAIYVYNKVKEDVKLSEDTMKSVLVVARNGVCSNKDMKKIIDMGISIEYIYIKDEGVGVVNIDSCN